MILFILLQCMKVSVSHGHFRQNVFLVYTKTYVYINKLHKCMLSGLFCDCQYSNRMTASVKLSDNSIDRGYIVRKWGLRVFRKAGVALTLPHPLINPHFTSHFCHFNLLFIFNYPYLSNYHFSHYPPTYFSTIPTHSPTHKNKGLYLTIT